ncbi:iron transporter [Lachnospiraceae bacterium JLR.KK009]
MKNRAGIVILALLAALLGGCGGTGSTQGQTDGMPQKDAQETPEPQTGSSPEELADGTYLARFQTDSGMFHVSEACEGKGTLTVENGEMTIHISLASKNIVNLYPGRAEDARKEGAKLLEPTEDTVTYSDGMTDEVYGFDVPVPALGTEFDLALIGKKGKWYDHKATVSDPVPMEDGAQGESGDAKGKHADALQDGTYCVDLTFEGGSGKAEILSPATLTVADGKMTATLQWNSPNYDYMVVDGEKYLPIRTEGGSVFELPVSGLDEPMDVIGDTVAMSRPHEVEYTLTFQSGTIQEK